MERLSSEAGLVLYELPRFWRSRLRSGWQTSLAGVRTVLKQMRLIIRNKVLKIGRTLVGRAYVYICEDY